MSMKTLGCVLIAVLTATASTGLQAQASGASNGGKELGDLMDKIETFKKSGVKGWTCRDPQGGNRMHRMDPTNIARMGKIPSSTQGFFGNKTPVEALPICTEPQ